MDDLTEQLRDGTPDAYRELLARHGDAVYRYVRRMVGESWAEDVTQEIFLRVVRGIPKYRPEGRFEAWLFTIARHACLDFLKTNRRPPADAVPSFRRNDSVGGDDTRRAILEAVERLPDEQREVFLLRADGGLSFREIAEAVGVPLNTALGRMHYAVLKLRESVKVFEE